jgi:hypothetical protein
MRERSDCRLRIRTSMQVDYDRIAVCGPGGEVECTFDAICRTEHLAADHKPLARCARRAAQGAFGENRTTGKSTATRPINPIITTSDVMPRLRATGPSNGHDLVGASIPDGRSNPKHSPAGEVALLGGHGAVVRSVSARLRSAGFNLAAAQRHHRVPKPGANPRLDRAGVGARTRRL